MDKKDFETAEIFINTIRRLKRMVALFASRDWFNKINHLMREQWADSLEMIHGKLLDLFKNSNSQNEKFDQLMSKVEDFSMGIKEPENAVLKAYYDKQKEIGSTFTADNFRMAMKDQVRLRLEIKDDADPAEVTKLLIDFLGSHKFTVHEPAVVKPSNIGNNKATFVIFKAPVSLSSDFKTEFLVEAQIRRHSDRDTWEDGASNHVNKDIERFSRAYGITERLELPQEFLRRLRARAVVWDKLNKQGGHTDSPPFLVPLRYVSDTAGTSKDMYVTLYGEAILADALSKVVDISRVTRFEIEGNDGLPDLRQRIKSNHKIIAYADDSDLIDNHNKDRIQLLKDILAHSYSQTTQFQAAAALAESYIEG